MEYEIHDDPQGERDRPDGDRDGGLVEDYPTLTKRSRFEDEEYLVAERGERSRRTSAPQQMA